jgi:hypothetical protein
MDEQLLAILHMLADAIHRPADYPAAELHAVISVLSGAPAAPQPPAPQDEPMPQLDAPAVFQPAPAAFGTESEPAAGG